MSYEPPTPPADLPPELVKALNGCSPESLREAATYAEELAEHKEREKRVAKSEDENETDKPQDDRPAEVPSKATTTIKEINDNRYYYWQWRDGDKIKSKYKGPVNSGQ